ncbi:MAG: hypothetical protein JRJ49_08280 [Deltaproteobacteria bacterium]|nr:hypothetical protein [Deltaproteobacteria bacterium]
MINSQKEKTAAAIAGVIAYIRQNEDAMAHCAVPEDKPEQKSFELNLWGTGGRQDMMNMRLMMQLKAFK